MTRTRYAIWTGDAYIADPGADHQAIEMTGNAYRALRFATPERAAQVAQSILERMSLPLSVVAVDLEY